MEATRIGALDIAVISNTAPVVPSLCTSKKRFIRFEDNGKHKTREPGYKLTNDSLSPQRRVQPKER